MRVVIAIDSFKGSLSSVSAGNAVKEAILKLDASSKVEIFPLADGGEGTVSALHSGLGGEMISIPVTGPLGKKVNAEYCILPNNCAVIEMAAAAGITLVSEKEKNPLFTTTFGVGEIILDAIKRNCRRFIIGIGGSATNDGGTGMLSALGYDFLDENGKPIPLGAIGLKSLHSICSDNVIPELKECSFRIACDVSNPLCGDNGCSEIFARQKGATDESIKQMDTWLSHFAKLAKTVSANADENAPGAGAAGGMGFAFLSFTNAKLESGIKIILEEIGIEEKIKDADIVVTGEGRLDSQTVMGKAPIGVAALAKKYGKRVIAFSGCVTRDATLCNEHGIDAFFPVVRGVSTLEEALNEENAYKNLFDCAEQVFRLIAL